MGQSRHAAAIKQARRQFKLLPLREFFVNERVDLGALVELESRGQRTWYFIGPKAGGTEVRFGGVDILIITPQSPLGSQLIGITAGARVKIGTGGREEQYVVRSVH